MPATECIYEANNDTEQDVLLIKQFKEIVEEFGPKNSYQAVKDGKYRSGLFDTLKEIVLLGTTGNCTEEEYKGIGFKALKCLIVDYKEKRRPYGELAMRFGYVAMIWVSVGLVVAVPLWCTKGWCSCCLCCKFFKPRETIQEAKNYMLLNPPGIMVTKKGGIIHYEPTEREKDCYEEFGHFIGTL